MSDAFVDDARPPSRASSFDLPPAEGRLLQELLLEERARLLQALAAAKPPEAICTIALPYADDEPSLAVQYAAACTLGARERLLAAGGGVASALWRPPEWDLWDFLDAPQRADRSGPVAEALLRRGCEDPAGAFLMDVAYAINRTALPVSGTADFACWATDLDYYVPQFRWLEAVARPDVVVRYRTRGWHDLARTAG